VAVVLSGREAASLALPALREMASLRCAALVVAPAHGDEAGRAVPGGPFDDLALLFEAPIGVLVAGAAREACELTLAACALASGASTPWCVAFELARVGCAVGPLAAPSRDEAASWWSDAPDEGVTRDAAVAQAWERITRRAAHLAPVAGACAPGGDVSVRVGRGDWIADAPTVHITQVRPFPGAALASVCRGARSVAVCEPWPDAFDARGQGRLTAQVRAVLAGLVAGVSEVGAGDRRPPAARVRLAWNEPERGALVRACVRFAAGLGWRVRAAQHEPWAATLTVQATGAGAIAPCDVVIAEASALGLLAVIGDSPRVDEVLLLGACDAARLREVAEACAARGATLRHEPDATLRG
jgi:hypothetical protein